MHGYQLHAVADRTGGAWRLSPGAGQRATVLTEARRALYLIPAGEPGPSAAGGDASS